MRNAGLWTTDCLLGPLASGAKRVGRLLLAVKRLLLAELDLRLKLVSGLIAALAGEPGGAG